MITNSFIRERTNCLKLGLEFTNKVQKHKRHCFLKSYEFHSLQGMWKPLAYLFYKDSISNKKN